MISFAGGLPDPESFPLDMMRESYREIYQYPELFQYNATKGLEGLIAALTKRLSLTNERSLFITSGSQQGLDLIARSFIAPGDKILVEAPSYLGAIQVFKLAGADLQSISILNSGPDLEKLKECFESQQIKFFYAIPDYQNPTGYCYPQAMRSAIAQLCREYGVIVIEDSPYRELAFNGKKQASISEFYPEGTIVLHSFSKIVSPGLRIGCVEAKHEIINTLIKLKQITDLHSNIPSQYVLQKLLEHSNFEQHIRSIRHNYHNKYQLLTTELKRSLADEVSFEAVDGGMFIWLTFKDERIEAEEFARKALENKLAVVPGNVFYVDEKADGRSIRLNFSHPSLANIEEGVKRFKLTMKANY
jgi:DNA-binding transcriptional MocR family regulator